MNPWMEERKRRCSTLHQSRIRERYKGVLRAVVMAGASLHLISLANAQISHGESAVIQTTKDVLALSTAEADKSHPVAIRGVVTGATEYGIFVQDHTAGIWVSIRNSRRIYSSGELVEVRGKTIGGLFSPDVNADTVIELGHAALPVPKKVTLKSLLAGNENDQFVAVTGIVRSVSSRPNVSESQRVWLNLLVDGVHISATLPVEDAVNAQALLGAVVRIEAAVACTKNADRQITSVVLSTMGMHNIKVLKPPPSDLFDAPLLPVKQLLQYRAPVAQDGRVRVKGIVTYVRPGESLIIEDGAKAALVDTPQRTPVKPGDLVEVSGYPTAAPSGPYLNDAVYRFLSTAAPPSPHHATLEELSSGRLNYNLVSITGKLLHHVNDPLRQEMLLQQGAESVSAELSCPAKSCSLDWLRDGSTVRITGISVLTVEGSWNQGGPAASALHYSIMLRSPADIVELEPPSWWSAKHLFYIAAFFAALMLVSFALTLYGRLQHWRLETISAERERVAHEVHDTLAQSFAGIGFQLQAIRRAIPGDHPELSRQVETARALVQHSHKEARQSIDPRDLRTLEGVDVLKALEESARKLVEGGNIVITARREGTAQALPAMIKDVLLHVGQEATANAVRHADPTEIAMALEYSPGSVKLTVADNGTGFEERGDILGFGLRGMRKRATSVRASLAVVSKIGQGTSVVVVCPLPRNLIGRVYHSLATGA